MVNTVILVHETEAQCRERLLAMGFPYGTAVEIASYLAQSTDMMALMPQLRGVAMARGIGIIPVEVTDLAHMINALRPNLIWPLTDGYGYFRGSAAAALSVLADIPIFGSAPDLYCLAQDKFRSSATLAAAGYPVPPAGLLYGDEVLVPLPPTETGYFVKPNCLGAKIGITDASRAATPDEVRAVAVEIAETYRDRAIVQPYIPGRNIRVSYLRVHDDACADTMGIFAVDHGGDFQTAKDSMALYGQTRSPSLEAPAFIDLDATEPEVADRIRAIVWPAAQLLGLRDVFSFDLRLDGEGMPHILEFEVSPGIPCFDFGHFVEHRWQMPLTNALTSALGAAITRSSPYELDRLSQ
ncbi:MAG: D-alanine:D-lactate ligase-like protein [Rhodobiaceae bacterium]|nr:D-alanine:D-lactate ligase-like protein [Rhodobiaceae bacterium]